MPVRDIVSDQDVTMVMNTSITENTVTESDALDLAHADSGVMFYIAAPMYADGTFTVALEDSPTGSVWTAVPAAKVILPDGAVTITSFSTAGTSLKRLGAFSVDRYVKLIVTSADISITGATITGYGIRKAELRPTV